MATTTLEGLEAMAWGLPGSSMVRWGWEVAVLWMWRVLSQEAEMRMAVMERVRCWSMCG